jgi:hypothetical protein
MRSAIPGSDGNHKSGLKIAFDRLTYRIVKLAKSVQTMTTQRPNPMAGPAYVVALQNALEKRVNEYRTPPRTGGIQISTRFDEFVLNHVDAIVEESGWNRAEVLYALVQRGLFDLYAFLAPEVTETIIHKIVAKMAPPQPPAIPERDR